MESLQLLKFRMGNAKLDAGIAHIALPAGYTCPGAKECLAKADQDTGKITDGKYTKFRCYAATEEGRPSVRQARHWNFAQLLRAGTTERMRLLIDRSMPDMVSWVRIHTSGDFFSRDYFEAWMQVAEQRPHQNFYAYTKELPPWINRYFDKGIPANMSLVASRGGRHDHLIDQYELREAVVVYHPEQAEELGLEIDHDERLARDPRGPRKFALLLHGTQPKGSEASQALSRMRREKVEFSYPSKKHVKVVS